MCICERPAEEAGAFCADLMGSRGIGSLKHLTQGHGVSRKLDRNACINIVISYISTWAYQHVPHDCIGMAIQVPAHMPNRVGLLTVS